MVWLPPRAQPSAAWPQLKVMGVDATDALFSAIVSALASGAGVVLGLLQAKFGAVGPAAG